MDFKKLPRSFSWALTFIILLNNTPSYANDEALVTKSSLNKQGNVDTVVLSQPETPNVSVVPNKWIVQLNLPSESKFARAISAKNAANKSALKQQVNQQTAFHREKLVVQQNDFVQRAKSKYPLLNVGAQFTKTVNAMVIYADDAVVEELRLLPEVRNIAAAIQYYPLLDRTVPAIEADKVWGLYDGNELPVTGQGITVAVFDTGIDYTHPDLGGCFGENCKVLGGYDFINDDADPLEDEERNYRYFGHGTEVSGIIAANGEQVGVAPDANILAYKVCGRDGCPTEAILSAIDMVIDPDGDPATDDQPQVVNLSLGSLNGDSTTVTAVALNELVQQGIVVVAASGNEGGFGEVGAIGSAPDAITVGALDYHFSDLASFSSSGPTTVLHNSKPEVIAPGSQIYTTSTSLKFDSRYAYAFGTSFAAPHVSGVAALLAQLYPSASATDLKSMIVNTGSPLDGVEVYQQGAGKINALLAAQSELLMQPSIVNFGVIDFSQSSVSEQVSVMLTNRSVEQRAFNVSIEGDVPEGVSFSIIGDSDFTLGANQSTSVEFQLSIDNSVFDVSRWTEIGVSARAVVTGLNVAYNIPLFASNMVLSNIELDNTKDTELNIINETNPALHEFRFFQRHRNQSTSLLLPIGSYTGVYAQDSDEGLKVNVVSGINIGATNEFNINFDAATRELKPVSLSRNGNELIDRQDYRAAGAIFEFAIHSLKFNDLIARSNLGLEGLGFSFINKSLFLPESNDDIEFNVGFIVSLFASSNASSVEFFSFADNLSNVDSDFNYNIDLDDYSPLIINVDDAEALVNGVGMSGSTTVMSRDGYNSDVLDVLSNNSPQAFGVGQGTLDENLSKKLMFEPFTFELSYFRSGNELADNTSLFSFSYSDSENQITSLLRQHQPDKNTGIDLINTERGFPRNEKDRKIDANSVDFSPLSFVNQSIRVDKDTNGLLLSGGNKDQLSNFVTWNHYEQESYTLTCEGSPIRTFGLLYGSAEINLSSSRSCDYFEHFGEVRYLSEGILRSSSFSMVVENRESPFFTRTADVIYATDEDFNIIRKGELDSVLIHALVHNDIQYQEVKIEVKGNGDWQSLDIVEIAPRIGGKNRYTARFNVPELATDHHIRVTLIQDENNYTTSQINSSLVVGRDISEAYVRDFDNDGIPDFQDDDDDNDGYLDVNDAFPLDANEWEDLDQDGIGDNQDTEVVLPEEEEEEEIQLGVFMDYDGDGKADIAVRNRERYVQYVEGSKEDETLRIQFGKHRNDIPITGDFDGDGIADIAVRRPGSFMWYAKLSSDGSIMREKFGLNEEDIPVPADYDGDGKTDVAVLRISNQTWYVKLSSDGSIIRQPVDVLQGDAAVPADYDGDGKADIAYFRSSTNKWTILQSSDGNMRPVFFGGFKEDIPVPADYDGDGKADFAIRRPSTHSWNIRNGINSSWYTVNFGLQSTDIPIVADYDGDGRADIAVRRPSTHMQYIKLSSNDETLRVKFGRDSGYIPIAAPINLKLEMLRD